MEWLWSLLYFTLLPPELPMEPVALGKVLETVQLLAKSEERQGELLSKSIKGPTSLLKQFRTLSLVHGRPRAWDVAGVTVCRGLYEPLVRSRRAEHCTVLPTNHNKV